LNASKKCVRHLNNDARPHQTSGGEFFCYNISMTDLTDRKCRACELGVGKLNPADVEAFMTHVSKWSVKDSHEISRRFKFKNFAEALAFVNKVGALAENEGHHPDIKFGWGYVRVSLSTHSLKGLSENDFIVATKIDLLI